MGMNTFYNVRKAVFVHGLASLSLSGWLHLLIVSGALPGVCCNVLAPWNSTASDPLPPAIHDSALTQQPLNTVPISTWGEGLGRPQCTPEQGCPDTSTGKQTQTSASRSCLLSALGSQGNPRQKTKMLAFNSRAPCSKDASFPCLPCYCVLSLNPFFFLIPLIWLELHVNHLSPQILLGSEDSGGKGINI